MGGTVVLRRVADGRWARRLGMGLLILSLIHVPLPQADYHNIRHHDAPGEVCVYHDHLLRWHPSADFDDDVSMLHWHWFVPLVELGDQHLRPSDDHHRPGSGPAMHAHVGDWLQGNDWRSEPVMQPQARGRLLAHLGLGQSNACSAYVANHLSPLHVDPGGLPARSGVPAAALRAARTALFERWNC
jgi:hypothetical protein